MLSLLLAAGSSLDAYQLQQMQIQRQEQDIDMVGVAAKIIKEKLSLGQEQRTRNDLEELGRIQYQIGDYYDDEDMQILGSSVV
jgi:hypothetical protein